MIRRRLISRVPFLLFYSTIFLSYSPGKFLLIQLNFARNPFLVMICLD